MKARDYRSSGKFPIVDQGQGLVAGWTNDENGLISEQLPVVVFGDHTRAFKYLDFPFVRGADGTQILKLKPGIDPLFFYFACRRLDLPSRGYNRHFTALKRQTITVPDPGTQEMIAGILRRIELAAAVQDEQVEAARTMKRTARRVLFTRGLRGGEQKESDIGPVPETWNVVNFGTAREWLQYGTSVRCTYEPTPFPVLRIPNIEPGFVSVQDIKFGLMGPGEAARYRLEKGDLLFVRTNGRAERLGTCAVYEGSPPGALFASYLIRARPKTARLNPHFAAQFFSSESITRLIAERATPAADGKFNLNKGGIDNLPIAIPSTLDEQQEIVSILDAIDRKIDLHHRKRVVLDELFKTLLHGLMTGEIRVADLDLSALGKLQPAGAAA